MENPELIEEAWKRLGKERLVVAIDGKKNSDGSGPPRLEVVVRSGEDALRG